MTENRDSIPLLNLAAEIDSIWEPLHAAVDRVLRSGRFILGPELAAFEQEVASYLGVRYAVGVASGTDALVISLRALGVGRGDEVITTPFTFVATAEAICHVGATPVFVDIDPDTFNIDANLIEQAITPRTKAILPVHLFGLAAEMDAIAATVRRHNLRLVEDAAQAFGGRYQDRMLGTIGDAGAFSFFPSKNLGGLGDGGLIVTDREEVAEIAGKLRNHGGRDKYRAEMLGYNSRLDELQAAMLRVKLPHIDDWNNRRREAARQYGMALAGVSGLKLPVAPRHCHHVFHQYTIRVDEGQRQPLVGRLASEDVGHAIYYPVPLHRIAALQREGECELPHAQAAAETALSIPIGPNLTADEQSRVIETLASWRGLKNRSRPTPP